MDFKELIIRAKRGECNAQEELLNKYHPLLFKESIVEGIFDEDLFQELSLKLILCIYKFET